MAAQTLEVSRFTVDVTKGTNITDAVIGTVSGAVHGITATRLKEAGPISTYEVVVVHDDGTPIALEYTVRNLALTENTTPVLSATLATVAGATQAVDISKLDDVAPNINSFDIFIVHLNA